MAKKGKKSKKKVEIPPGDYAVRIDVVSDVVCPWCYIGKKRLDHVVDIWLPGWPVTVRWRPFFLDPNLPPEGVDRMAYIAEKHGDPARAKQVYDVIAKEGAKDGIAFQFDQIARVPNTMNAHRVSLWASEAGVQGHVIKRLFELYFEEGADLGDKGVLICLAREAGMNTSLIADLLDGDADKDRILRDVTLAYQLGVKGVPTYIFNGRYGLVGAQDKDELLNVIIQLSYGRNPQAET